MQHIDKGKDAETLAGSYLAKHGLSLVQRNYHSRHGEIDLVMADGDCIVFVEVRYRRQSAFGSGAETVDHSKQARITACARHYLQQHPAASARPCRFDVVGISGSLKNPQFDWIPDAFPASG
ncbi:MAG: YraN family protein [Gammaproteobacteria bacterium]|jgi:putative endonuclease|nr:YraN family protein [Gammaproteobacteria bacterium]